MSFTERETFLASLSHQQLLSEALRLDAMLTALARMVRELTTSPPVTSQADDDRYQELLIEAMRAVMAQNPNYTSPDWIAAQAGATADGLYDKLQAKWTKP